MQQIKTLQSAGYTLILAGDEIKVKKPAKPLPMGLEAPLFQAIKANKATAREYLSSASTPTTPRPLTHIATTLTAMEEAILSGDMDDYNEAWLITQWQIAQAERGVLSPIGSDGLSHAAWAEGLMNAA